MNVEMKLTKKMMCISLILILFLVIGAACAADNDTDVQTSDDDTQEIISSDTEDVNQTLKATVQFSGTTFSDLETAINNAQEGDTIVLNSNITNDYRNYQYYPMTINKAITIEGQGYTIDGASQSAIFSISGSNVVLNNITFINAYGNSWTYRAGAIYGTGSNVNITNCNFIDNVLGLDWSTVVQ